MEFCPDGCLTALTTPKSIVFNFLGQLLKSPKWDIEGGVESFFLKILVQKFFPLKGSKILEKNVSKRHTEEKLSKFNKLQNGKLKVREDHALEAFFWSIFAGFFLSKALRGGLLLLVGGCKN